MDKTALILVDIQNDYFPGGKMTLEGVEPACANAARLLRHFRNKRLPVFHVRHLATRSGAAFFLPDTPGSEIHPSVAPMHGETLVVKHFPNSFRETTLRQHLKDAGITSVAVCGAMSHMCIDATVRAAFDYGFTSMVAHDACATKALHFGSELVPAAQVHAAFMASLSGTFAQVLPARELIEKIG
jgi:nicotinamidase-related amidase